MRRDQISLDGAKQYLQNPRIPCHHREMRDKQDPTEALPSLKNQRQERRHPKRSDEMNNRVCAGKIEVNFLETLEPPLESAGKIQIWHFRKLQRHRETKKGNPQGWSGVFHYFYKIPRCLEYIL